MTAQQPERTHRQPLAGRHPAADAAKKYEMPGTRTVLVVRSTR